MTFNHRRSCSIYISFFVCVLVCKVYVCLFCMHYSILFIMFFRCMLDVCKFIPCCTSIFYLFVYLSIFLSIYIIHLHDDVFIDMINHSWSGPSDSGPILWGHKNRKVYTAIAPLKVQNWIYMVYLWVSMCCSSTSQSTHLFVPHSLHSLQAKFVTRNFRSDYEIFLHGFTIVVLLDLVLSFLLQFGVTRTEKTTRIYLPGVVFFGRIVGKMTNCTTFLETQTCCVPGWCIDIIHKVAEKYDWTPFFFHVLVDWMQSASCPYMPPDLHRNFVCN